MKGLQKKPIQIYLESRQNNTLQLLAKRMGISKAEIIRKSLDKFLSELPVEEDPAMGLIGLGNSSKGDLSEKHDIYLARYGSSKKK
jgi:hypothetical protein